MSEWGNPVRLNSVRLLFEHIEQVEGTAGIETSQYRIGKESNSDSLSSGERNGIQPKHDWCQALRRCQLWVVGVN